MRLELPQPRQSRSLKTQQAFIDAGWGILRDTPWETISIAMIAARAGRSVGVFYQRFGSKEDFLTLMLHTWLDQGQRHLQDPIAGGRPREVIAAYLAATFERISTNRYLWRAALQRAMDDPASWEPFRNLGALRRQHLADQLGLCRKRQLDAQERHRLDLATQVFNSVINNALLNDPGPLRVDQPEFLPTLEQIFLTVAALDLD